MAFKDVLVPIILVEEDECALRAAEIVADLVDARVSGVFLAVEPDAIATADALVSGVRWGDLIGQIAADAGKVRAALEARPSSRRIGFTEMRSTLSRIGADLGEVARCTDLVVMTRPIQDLWTEQIRTAAFEGVLFGSGRPVLLTPTDWRGTVGRNIIIAWNGSHEAARAAADALPLLQEADKVTIVSVVQSAEDCLRSAQTLAAHLLRHGVKAATKAVLASHGDDTACLVAEALDGGADLVVMGGYGRARAAEWAFGGVTRALSRTASFPVFMSH